MNDERPAEKRTSVAGSGHGKWDGTLTLLNQRVAQDPKNAASWTNRGILLRILADYEGASRDFREALRLDPSSVHALLGQGDLYLALHRYSEAIEAYNTAIALDPERSSSYLHRGSGYVEQGRHAEAIADFTKSADLEPGWSQPYFRRASARNDVKDFQGALSDYDTFFRLERKSSELIGEAHGLRAFIYMRLGRYREAIADYDVELQLTPRDAIAYIARSRAHQKAGNHARAAEDRKKAIQLDPTIREWEGGARDESGA